MNATNIAYLARLIDGEGCVSIRKSTRKNSKNPQIAAGVRIGMTAKNVIYWIRRTTGLGSVWPVHRSRRKVMWYWDVTPQDAITVAKIVLPYLRLKQEHAINLIRFQNQAIGQSHTGKLLTKTKLDKQMKFYYTSRKLNRGKHV